MEVLVTGGAGYIGSHAVKELEANGFEPIVIDDLSTGHRDFVKGPFYSISLLDKEKLAAVFKQHKIKAIFHFASKSIVQDSVDHPEEYLSHNVEGTKNLICVAKEHSNPFFIFSSTACVYGNPKYTPIDERHLLAPINPYGLSKLQCEELIKTSLLPYVIFRFFNAAGASKDLDVGERHHPETHLIPNVIQSIQEDQPVYIFGNDYPTQDGTCIRDYVHVLDIAAAYIKALDYLQNGGISTICNLGSQKGHSVKEVIEKIMDTMGQTVPIETKPRRFGDLPILVASHKKAIKELKITFEYSLDEIISSAICWHEKEKSVLK
jgi:UDP-glucose 4-epimerase